MLDQAADSRSRAKRGYNPWSTEEKDQAVTLKSEGLSSKAIARRMPGRSAHAIRDLLSGLKHRLPTRRKMTVRLSFATDAETFALIERLRLSAGVNLTPFLRQLVELGLAARLEAEAKTAAEQEAPASKVLS